MPRNPLLCSVASFLIVSRTPFINKLDSSLDLINYFHNIINFFEIINVVVPDTKIFFWIAATVAYTAAVNRNVIKTLLANGLSVFFLKASQFLVMV